MSGRRIAVLGGGGWGTALAQVAARAGNEVVLWARDPAVVAAVNAYHRNPRYLSDLTLDPAVRATADLAVAVGAVEAALLVVPAQALRGLAADLAATGAAPTTAVICARVWRLAAANCSARCSPKPCRPGRWRSSPGHPSPARRRAACRRR